MYWQKRLAIAELFGGRIVSCFVDVERNVRMRFSRRPRKVLPGVSLPVSRTGVLLQYYSFYRAFVTRADVCFQVLLVLFVMVVTKALLSSQMYY